MTKRTSIAFTLSLISLTTSLFPMHNLIFRSVQLGSALYCIKKGFNNFYDYDYSNKKLNSDIEQGLHTVNGSVSHWVKKEIEKLDVPEDISILYGSNWASNTKVLFINSDEANILEFLLNNGSSELEKEKTKYNELLEKRKILEG